MTTGLQHRHEYWNDAWDHSPSACCNVVKKGWSCIWQHVKMSNMNTGNRNYKRGCKQCFCHLQKHTVNHKHKVKQEWSIITSHVRHTQSKTTPASWTAQKFVDRLGLPFTHTYTHTHTHTRLTDAIWRIVLTKLYILALWTLVMADYWSNFR